MKNKKKAAIPARLFAGIAAEIAVLHADDLPQVDNGLGYSIFSLNGFGIGLIVALRHDQIDQLLGDIDVRLLQRTGLNTAQCTRSGRTYYRLARLE